MCTDKTKQELIFLLSFMSEEESVGSNEISMRMSDLLARIGWAPYLLRVPHIIEELTRHHADHHHIQKATPVSWRLMSSGRSRIDYLISRYIPAGDHPALNQVMQIAA